jgi:DNA repair protein RadC
VDHAPLYPREVARRALELDASAVVLLHNHPSGDPAPSPADVDATRRAADALAAVGVALHDHAVVGRERVLSMRKEGLL